MSDETPKEAPHPSQKLTPTIHETFTIVDEAVKSVGISTKIQWVAIGSLCMAFAAFAVWGLATVSNVGIAQAQTKAKSDATDTAFTRHLLDDTADKILLKNAIEEGRKDTKALYQAIMTRRPQPRLEKLDAGTDDP